MKKNVILLLIVSLALSFTACNKIKTDTNNNLWEVDTDVAALQNRIVQINEPMEWTKVNSTNLKAAQSFSAIVSYKVQAPHKGNWDGNNFNDYLSASSIEFWDGKIYIGFHDRGEEFYGEIFVYTDATHPTDPTANTAINSRFIDVNDMEFTSVNADLLWVAGESNNRGAEALTFDITGTSGLTSEGIQMPIFGASANSITAVGTDVWITSGGDQGKAIGNLGGLIVMDANTPGTEKARIELDNTKHFDSDGTLGLMVYGNSAGETNFAIWENLSDIENPVVFSYTNAGFQDLIDEEIDLDVTDKGKNSVDVLGDFGYIALGKAGVFRINLNDANGATKGALSKHYFDASNNGWANGVKTDGTHVFVANGADGLIVLDMDLVYVGTWNGTTRTGTTSDNNGSCNYVDVEGNNLYVAFGRGGFVKLVLSY